MKDDGDRSLALQCLLEGEATLVMIKTALQAIPGADESIEEEMAPLLSAGALERANVPKGIPDYFVDQLFFPYVEGTAFVRAAVRRGWAEVDRLWRNPPESTAAILHGEPYPPPAKGLLPGNVATLLPGLRLSYTDTLGEWTLRFLLQRALTPAEAEAAAAGWRGDRIAFFASGSSMGYLWRLRFDGPGTAARFEAALTKARAKRPTPSPETITRRGADLIIASGLPRVPEQVERRVSRHPEGAARRIPAIATAPVQYGTFASLNDRLCLRPCPASSLVRPSAPGSDTRGSRRTSGSRRRRRARRCTEARFGTSGTPRTGSSRSRGSRRA
jgi:hypothetical protein